MNTGSPMLRTLLTRTVTARPALGVKCSGRTRAVHTEVTTKSFAQRLAEAETKVPLGLAVLGGSIAFLTLNERRAVKQGQLREHALNVVIPIDIDEELPDPHWSDQLVYCFGWVEYASSPPKDDVLGLSREEAIRLRRHGEMYQWVEHRHEEKKENKDGSETTLVTYTYTKEWKSFAESISHSSDHRNPPFPSELQGWKTFDASDLICGRMHVFLGRPLVEKIRNFVPLSVSEEEVPNAANYNLALSDAKGSSVLYTQGGQETSPRIGDIRIRLMKVDEGFFTIVAKIVDMVERAPGVFTAFKGELKQTLASQGAIEAPEEIKQVTGGAPFLIPEWLVEVMETALLTLVPLEIAHIEPGKQTLERAFDGIKEYDEENRVMMQLLGSIGCMMGSSMAMSPLVVLRQARAGAAVVAGAVIAFKTIRAARISADPEGRYLSTEGSVEGLLGRSLENDEEGDVKL